MCRNDNGLKFRILKSLPNCHHLHSQTSTSVWEMLGREKERESPWLDFVWCWRDWENEWNTCQIHPCSICLGHGGRAAKPKANMPLIGSEVQKLQRGWRKRFFNEGIRGTASQAEPTKQWHWKEIRICTVLLNSQTTRLKFQSFFQWDLTSRKRDVLISKQ